jgi:hypothetical protein
MGGIRTHDDKPLSSVESKLIECPPGVVFMQELYEGTKESLLGKRNSVCYTRRMEGWRRDVRT